MVNQNRKPFIWIVLIIFSGAFLILLSYTVNETRDYLSVHLDGNAQEGIIKKKEIEKENQKGEGFYFEIAYTTGDEDFQCRRKVEKEYYHDQKVGVSIPLLISNQDPRLCYVAEGDHTDLWTLIFLAGVLLFVGFTIFALIMVVRR